MKNKYTHVLCYSTDRKNIEIAKVLNTEERNAPVVKSEEINPECVAWVLIYYLKGNELTEIKTKFGTLKLGEESICKVE